MITKNDVCRVLSLVASAMSGACFTCALFLGSTNRIASGVRIKTKKD